MSDDFFIRRFARERDRGDLAAAMAVWEELTIRSFDRVRAHVVLFRFPGGQPIDSRHHDDATSVAFARAYQLGENFRGTTAAEFRAALKKTVWHACMDWGRGNLAYEIGIGGSLDERYDDGDASPHDEALARHLADIAAAGHDAEQAGERGREDAELVHWGITQVENESHRTVLELTFVEKLSGEEIAARLTITIDNVYQRRKRGLQALEQILRDNRP